MNCFVSGRLLACVTASAAMTGVGQAELLIYEPFDYAATSGVNNGSFFGDGNQSGALGLGTWVQTNSGSNELDVETPGLTFTDNFGYTLPVAGNTLEREVRVGQAVANAPLTGSALGGVGADGTTLWMSLLYQDRGFSGPDFGIALTSEQMLFGDAQALANPGVGVGIGINGVGGPARAIGSIVYENATSLSFTPEATASMDGPGASNIRFLVMQVNWNPDGIDDEVYIYDLTEESLLSVPLPGSAIASYTMNFSAAEQASIDNLAISESQISYIDEVRVATTYAEVIGIPEPSSLALLGLSGLLVARRRRA